MAFCALALWVSSSLVGFSLGYNILVTDFGMSGSQNLVMFRLADILAESGRNKVTLIHMEYLPGLKKPKLVNDVNLITYDPGLAPSDRDFFAEKLNKAAWDTSGGFPPIGKFLSLINGLANVCEKVLTDKKLLGQLKAAKLDVAIFHLPDLCGMAAVRSLGVNATIWFSPAMLMDPMAWFAGVPSPPAHVTTALATSSKELSFAERVKNFALKIAQIAALKFFLLPKFDKVIQRVQGPQFPSAETILREHQLFFVNVDPLFGGGQPVAHDIVYVGGLTMENIQELPQEWNDLLARKEAKEHGVIFFSLGTVANTKYMPQFMKEAFLGAFKKRKELIIWRLEGSFPEAANVPNIHITKWAPQKDLLAHPRLKAFITHGGYNSLTEATYMGVPLIMLPLFGDQFANVKKVERLGIGAALSVDTLSEKTVFEAISTVVDSPKIREAANLFGRMIRGKPESGKTLAIQWTEYLAEFKSVKERLSAGGTNLCLFTYYSLDVIFAFLLGFCGLIFAGLFCCKMSCKLCCGGRAGKPKSD